jgi:hypothetical protein
LRSENDIIYVTNFIYFLNGKIKSLLTEISEFKQAVAVGGKVSDARPDEAKLHRLDQVRPT